RGGESAESLIDGGRAHCLDAAHDAAREVRLVDLPARDLLADFRDAREEPLALGLPLTDRAREWSGWGTGSTVLPSIRIDLRDRIETPAARRARGIAGRSPGRLDEAQKLLQPPPAV